MDVKKLHEAQDELGKFLVEEEPSEEAYDKAAARDKKNYKVFGKFVEGVKRNYAVGRRFRPRTKTADYLSAIKTFHRALKEEVSKEKLKREKPITLS